MAGINALIRNLEAIDMEQVIGEALEQTIEQHKIRLQNQMLHGEAKTGKIGKYRSLSYAARKVLINPLAGFGNVDLKLTGSFQDLIEIKVDGAGTNTTSADEKAEELRHKYGDEIYGLNKQNKSDYSLEDMGPVATRIIKAKIHKK